MSQETIPHAHCDAYATKYGFKVLSCEPCKKYFAEIYAPNHELFRICTRVPTLENRTKENNSKPL